MGQLLATSNQSWTWPAGVSTVVAEGVGAGGAGGEAQGNPSTGGGGSGGGYAKKTITKGAEASLTLNVGAAGTGTTAGGVSEVVQNGSTVLRATGGTSGGIGATNNSNGTGSSTRNGTAVGDATFEGGNGGTGDLTNSGAGGGAAGPSSAGGNASVGTAGTRGTGTWADGSTTRHSPGAAGQTAAASNGIAGGNYGGGGSGGRATSNPNKLGGDGGAGVILLTWTDPAPFAGDLDRAAFYNDDGSESTSTIIGTQNADATLDVLSGNKQFGLRTGIQETAGGAGGLATDDYTLRYSLNGGQYFDINGTFAGYGFENNDTPVAYTATVDAYGQTQVISSTTDAIGSLVDFVVVRMKRTGTLSGNVVCKIYDHSGTYGSTGIPGATLYGTSEPVDASTISTSLQNVVFVFATPVSIASGIPSANWAISIEYAGNDASNFLSIARDSTTPGASGNAFYRDASVWTALPTSDLCFVIGSYHKPIDHYPLANWGGALAIGFDVSLDRRGQSFTGDGSILDRILCKITRIGAATGDLYCDIYAHSGTFGSSSVPTGSPLATSDAVAKSSIPTTSSTFVFFTFSGANRITLTNATNYVFVLRQTNTANGTDYFSVWFDNSSPTHSGNMADYNSSTQVWSADSTIDLCFEVHTLRPIACYPSINVTQAGATTNRLTGGSGSFVAGKIGTGGSVLDLAITTSNRTELLYTLDAISANLAHNDQVDFKVYRNNAVLGAYTEIPRAIISKSAGPPSGDPDGLLFGACAIF